MTARPTRRRQTVFIGPKIRQLRKERGLTQAGLARKIGVQQSDLCRMENGEYKVSLDSLFRILGVFGLEIGEFFGPERITGGAEDRPGGRESEILNLIRRLDDAARADVLEFVRFKLSARSDVSNG